MVVWFGTDPNYILDCELFSSEIDWCLNSGNLFCEEERESKEVYLDLCTTIIVDQLSLEDSDFGLKNKLVIDDVSLGLVDMKSNFSTRDVV